MITHRIALPILLLAACLSSAATLPDIEGRVVGVHDGDTITLLTADKTQIKIRLEGIEAPESKQAFGNRAKQELSGLIFDKQVVIKNHGVDLYGRTLGRIICGNLDVNLEMVKRGMAWHFLKYSKEKALADAEKEASEAKRGLWADKKPVPQWEYRKAKKAK